MSAGHGARRSLRTASALRVRGLAVGIAVACLICCVYLAESQHDAALLRDANQAGLAGRYRDALAIAREVHRSPADGRAQLVQAYALRALGRDRAASAAFARAARRDPNNWTIHRDWGVLLMGMGRREQAGTELLRARALNPQLELPASITTAR